MKKWLKIVSDYNYKLFKTLILLAIFYIDRPSKEKIMKKIISLIFFIITFTNATSVQAETLSILASEFEPLMDTENGKTAMCGIHYTIVAESTDKQKYHINASTNLVFMNNVIGSTVKVALDGITDKQDFVPIPIRKIILRTETNNTGIVDNQTINTENWSVMETENSNAYAVYSIAKQDIVLNSFLNDFILENGFWLTIITENKELSVRINVTNFDRKILSSCNRLILENMEEIATIRNVLN